ncbi:hypothetical protein D3C80_720710 [compost metagenome]
MKAADIHMSINSKPQTIVSQDIEKLVDEGRQIFRRHDGILDKGDRPRRTVDLAQKADAG